MLRELLSLFTGEDESNKETESSSFGLTQEERKVRETQDYEVYNFDEEDLEEDDYYYEDED